MCVGMAISWGGRMVMSWEGHWTLRLKIKERKGGQKVQVSKQVDEKSIKVGLNRKDALCWSLWTVGDDYFATRLWWVWPLSPVGNSAGSLTLVCNSLSYFICLVKETSFIIPTMTFHLSLKKNSFFYHSLLIFCMTHIKKCCNAVLCV